MLGRPARAPPISTRSQVFIVAAAFWHFAWSGKSRKVVFTATPPSTETGKDKGRYDHIGRAHHRPQAGSTPHDDDDEVTTSYCSPFSPVANPRGRRSFKFPASTSIAPPIFTARRRKTPRQDDRHQPRRPHSKSTQAAVKTNPHNDCGTPNVPQPRFLPLEAFGRRPQQRAARSVTGRHPKPFTGAALASA
jgi:hypothetical protein